MSFDDTFRAELRNEVLKEELLDLESELTELKERKNQITARPFSNTYMDFDKMLFQRVLLLGGSFIVGVIITYLFLNKNCK